MSRQHKMWRQDPYPGLRLKGRSVPKLESGTNEDQALGESEPDDLRGKVLVAPPNVIPWFGRDQADRAER